MKKRIISTLFIAFCCLFLMPQTAKADSTYSMIAPGTTSQTATTLPQDGKDYVANFILPDTSGNFKFTVPENTQRFYNLYVKQISPSKVYLAEESQLE